MSLLFYKSFVEEGFANDQIFEVRFSLCLLQEGPPLIRTFLRSRKENRVLNLHFGLSNVIHDFIEMFLVFFIAFLRGIFCS